MRSETLSYSRGVCSDEDGSCGTRLWAPFLFSPQWCAWISPAPTPGPRSGCALGPASKENNWISELMPEGFSGGRRNGKKIESRDNYAKDIQLFFGTPCLTHHTGSWKCWGQTWEMCCKTNTSSCSSESKSQQVPSRRECVGSLILEKKKISPFQAFSIHLCN